MTDQAESPENGESPKAMISQLPHFAMRANAPRPPARPFFKPANSAERVVSEKAALERQSGDRSFIERMGVMAPTTNFVPPTQRRITEIPNLNAARALDGAADSKRLSISKHIKVSGEISGCEKLVVEGEVDAKLSGVTTLDICAQGKMRGTADVEGAVVQGTFEGTLVVRGHLDIPAGGSVRGTISYKCVTVANGAKLAGNITILED